MDAAADDLIAALSSPASHSGIHSRFASYLLPFFPHLPTPNPNPKPPTKKPTKQQRPRPPDDAAIRPLAKRFLPFLCRALHLLPSILRQNPSSGDAVSGSCSDELFEVYDLLLNCLATISPCLAGKPYSVLLQRGRFVCCLEARGHYARAEADAVATLDSLRSVLLPPLLAKPRRGAAAVPSLLPDPDLVGEANGGADPDVTTLATELTVCLANCACKGQVKEATAYDRVLALVEQVQPWIRLLADELGRKYQLLLLNSLSRCAFFLTAECALFDVDIVSGFCIMTLRECTKSPTIERLPAIARKICSTVDLGWGGSTLLLLDVLKIVVKSVVCGCEVDLSKAVNEFLEFVAYFSGSFSSTNRDVCIGASKLLYEQGGFFSEVSSPIDSVLFLYATGLYFSSQHRECEEKPQIAADFLSNVEYVQTFGESLVNLARFFCVANGRICVSLDNLCKDSGSLSTQHACSRKKHVCPQSHGCISFLSYLDSLEFVCKILLQHANAAWKHFSEEKTFCCSASMSYILTALHLFIDSCLAAYSSGTIQSEGDKERLHEKRGTLLRAIVSAIKISFVTNDKFEKSMSSINCVISSRWIMLEELKFLIPSLSNIGATLYNIGHLEQAPVALDLCCRAVWANVRLSYCRLSPTLEECRIIKDLPKDTTTDVIVDAFARITKIIDILHKCGAKNIYEIVVKSLSELLAAGDMSEYLKGSSVLIRQWIKIVCKDFVDDQSVDNAPLLYHSLKSNSCPLPQKMIGLILELELSAYGLMESRGTLLCRKMQKGIIDILLDDIYCSREYHLERSRVLVWKARALRACGGQNINSCLECLSEAISLLRSILLDCSQGSEPESHELAIAYCLHAHCAQEANLDCEVILNDVRCALNLWSKVGTLGNSSPGGIFQQQSDTLILLLCSMVDLLAMKGCSQFLFDLCKLMIVIWKQENLPLEKLFSLLFTNGRLNHALCNLPIDQGFICYVSQDLGINCHSIEFWRNCFKGHCHYLSMFHQRVWPTDLMFSQSCEHSFGRSFGFDVGVDEVKKTASSLVSEASLNDQSIFIAGYMYYDLSERFSSRGQVSQALYYAKEALQLRKKLLRKKFKFDLRKFVSSENHGCAGQGFVSLEASGSTITEIWPDFTRSGSVGEFLSPWNVLRCYLESILQVGIVHESTGKGAEAEVLFQTGKEISYLQGLPVFGITFTSLLGQLYRKRELWDVAENELKISRNLLAENETFISCKHCKLTLEISVDMQAGDLFWSLFEKDFQKQSINNLSNALVMYQSAVEKLNCSELELPLRSYDKPNTGCVLGSKNHIAETKGSVCNHGKAPCAANNVMSPSCTVCVLLSEASGDHRNGFVPSKSHRQISRNEEVGPLLDVRVKKMSRTASCLEKEQRLEAQAKTRTRFSKRTIHAKGEKALTEVNCTNGTSVSDQSCTNSLIHRKASCVIDGIGCSADDICNIFGCWNCLLAISLNSECIENILQLRWDGIRRRHLVALLLKTARALGAHGGKHGAHEVHNIYWQCISLLYFRSFPQDCYKTYGPHLLGLIMDANSDGFLSLERAAILYNMSFFLLKGSLSERLRGACCSFYSIEMSDAVPWLLKAFVLSQETPSLLQEVCRLLACIFLLSTVDSSIQLPLNSKGSLSLNHWAAYFHQTSVGTCLNWHHLSILGELCRTKHPKDRPENFLNKADEDILKFLRFSSENTDHLEEHITEFFHKLPSVPIVCISMLAGDFVNLLGETLLLPSCFPAWTLLSRFDSTNKPVTILLPVDVILEEMQCEGSSIQELGIATLVRDKNWHCPWGYSIIDYVAPSFRKLLEENFVSLSSATLHLTDGQANCVSWWSQRMKLNNHLDKILKNMEESWLGPWRCLLLGHQLANQHTEATLKKFITGLEAEFKLEVNPTLAKAILCGVKSVDEMQECISQLIPYKGYFGRGGCCGKDRFRAFSACHIEAEVPESLICLIENTVKELTEPVARDPVIFVLDTDVQMLPWENFPTIRSHEIYRMPSVGSVFLALTRSNHHYKDESIMAPSFPVVDLLNTFYLLNPSGDLSSTQEEFDQLFRNYEWKGKAGDAPTTEELVLALRNHDLFLYFGHGSGTQYISGKEIEKLDRCAAALLMGCSSGTLLCKGGYAPQGAPLSYLFAGSPAVIANLWDVSDKDIDRFSRALLDSWLQENVIAGNNCSKCCQVTKEFESMTITVGKNSRAKRKGTRGKKLQQSDDSKCCKCGSRRIALYMSEARRACKLPLMIGASPVCYGVPTIISKK